MFAAFCCSARGVFVPLGVPYFLANSADCANGLFAVSAGWKQVNDAQWCFTPPPPTLIQVSLSTNEPLWNHSSGLPSLVSPSTVGSMLTCYLENFLCQSFPSPRPSFHSPDSQFSVVLSRSSSCGAIYCEISHIFNNPLQSKCLRRQEGANS